VRHCAVYPVVASPVKIQEEQTYRNIACAILRFCDDAVNSVGWVGKTIMNGE
jgi:hypothetical protein